MSAREHLSPQHLSDDALLDGLYGLTGNAPHLRECSICAARFNEFRRRRESLAAADASSELSSDFLAAQRRKIYERLEQPERKRLRWAPALAMACVVAVGVMAYRPAYHPAYHQTTPPAPAQHRDVSDSQLFADAYSMDQSLEPSAAAPIHALFEDAN